MRKLNIDNEELKKMRDTVVILHGQFEEPFFDTLKNRTVDRFFVLEGRPNLESSKHVIKNLLKRKITPTIISDNMAGFLFYKQLVKEVYLATIDIDDKGALCHIGASILAVMAKQHNVKVFCYPSIAKKEFVGKPSDLTSFQSTQIAPKNTKAYVPLIEWIPGKNFEEVNKDESK